MRSTPAIALLLLASPVLAQQFSYVREHTPSFSGSSLYGSVTVFGDLTGDGIAEYGVADIDTSPQIDIFDGSDGSLYLSIAGSAEHFGLAGCPHPDVDGDGIPEIAIGESEFDSPSWNAGRVMVYSGADGSFIREIFGPASVASDQGFGQDMAPFVDINGDGLAEFLVSARKGGTGGHYSGSVSCIDGSSGAILYTVNGLGEYDYQARVGSHGPDIDGDGIPEFGIGAEENWASSGDGYLRIVSGADGTVLLTIDGWGTQLDRFGNSHVWTDDLDGDGLADIAISAPGQDLYGAEMGRVGVFSSGSGLLLQEIIPPQGVLNGFGDTMNSRMLALPDSDGDGIGEILIPASEYDDGFGICSAVFVCSPGAGSSLLPFKDPSVSVSSFGRSLELLDSLTAGVARVLIGGYDIGKGYVYDFYPDGGPNQAVSLDGTDDCVVISDHTDFDSVMTIEFWYLQRGPGDGYGVQHQVALFSDSNGQSTPQNLHQWQLSLRDQSSSHPFSPFRFEAAWDRELVSGLTDLGFMEWHHVATTWDGLNIRNYIDGVLENQISFVGTPSPWSHDIYLGAQDVLGTVARELDGTIDELRLWTIPRSESEIRNSMGLELDLQPGLLTVWHFNGDLTEPTGNYSSVFLGNGMFVPSTAPLNLDSDNDGLLDDDELVIHGTDPDLFDTDGDGLNDGQELGVTYSTAPALTNLAVFVEDTDPLTTTDPLLYDTDGGGTSDGNEDVDKNGAIDIEEDDPNDPLDDLFQLSVLGLSPGQQATISVWECRPGAVAVPLFSMAGQASSLYPGYNQLELALSSPINQLTGMTVGPGGTAFSTIWVPPYVSIGVSVYWQAVEITGGGDAYRPSIPIIAVVQ